MNKIYLDHAATTYVLPVVKKEMQKYYDKEFGNPSALYSLGLLAKKSLDDARQRVAKILNCQGREIIFTGSGTESDNLALQGVAKTFTDKSEIIISSIEHHAVLRTAKYLEKQGWKLRIAPVDEKGIIIQKELLKLVNNKTKIVSLMYANNEIGTVQPIKELVKKVKEKNKKIIFHTDACQAGPYLDLDVKKLGVDLLTLNGSKVYGPKGTGLLFVKQSTVIEPIIYGGGQEFNLRSGTENIPGIIGMVKALELAQSRKKKETERLKKLQTKLITGIRKTIKDVEINGHETKRLPNNVNISFYDIEGEAILLYLDKYGIMANTGSACASHDLDVSHVLKAIGLPYEKIHGSIRFTFGLRTKFSDIDYLLKVLPDVVARLRAMSPVHIKKNSIHPQIKK